MTRTREMTGAERRAWRRRLRVTWATRSGAVPCLHLRVSRLDLKSGIPWEVLEDVKNECSPGGWGIEVYPPAGEVVNEINQRHIFVLPEGSTLEEVCRGISLWRG